MSDSELTQSQKDALLMIFKSKIDRRDVLKSMITGYGHSEEIIAYLELAGLINVTETQISMTDKGIKLVNTFRLAEGDNQTSLELLRGVGKGIEKDFPGFN